VPSLTPQQASTASALIAVPSLGYILVAQPVSERITMALSAMTSPAGYDVLAPNETEIWCRWALVHSTDQRRDGPKSKLLCDDRLATDGIRASGRQHPVQHRHADGSLCLLGNEAAGAQPRPDQRLVAAHCRFY
jgi:hypothetical protein